MKTFRVSAAGRLYLFLQACATLLLLLFAAWFLLDTLGLELARWEASWQAARPTWTSGQLLPAAGLLVVIFAGPWLVWQVCAEMLLQYSVDKHGLRVQTLGYREFYPWEDIQVAPRGKRAPQQLELLVPRQSGLQVRQRLFHLYGRIPIHPQITNRKLLEQLLQQYLFQQPHSVSSQERS